MRNRKLVRYAARTWLALCVVGIVALCVTVPYGWVVPVVIAGWALTLLSIAVA